MYNTLFRIIYIFSTYKLNYLFLKFQIFYEEKIPNKRKNCCAGNCA